MVDRDILMLGPSQKVRIISYGKEKGRSERKRLNNGKKVKLGNLGEGRVGLGLHGIGHFKEGELCEVRFKAPTPVRQRVTNLSIGTKRMEFWRVPRLTLLTRALGYCAHCCPYRTVLAELPHSPEGLESTRIGT